MPITLEWTTQTLSHVQISVRKVKVIIFCLSTHLMGLFWNSFLFKLSFSIHPHLIFFPIGGFTIWFISDAIASVLPNSCLDHLFVLQLTSLTTMHLSYLSKQGLLTRVQFFFLTWMKSFKDFCYCRKLFSPCRNWCRAISCFCFLTDKVDCYIIITDSQH